MDLLALRTVRRLSPECGAQQHADRNTDGQPDADVSSYYSEHRAQRSSQRDAQSIEFRFVRHHLISGSASLRSAGPFGFAQGRLAKAPVLKRGIPVPSLRLRPIARLQGFVADLTNFAQQL